MSVNPGAVLTALIRDEQRRYKLNDLHLEAALHEHYDYISKHIDPIVSNALEELLLYQPDHPAAFLVDYLHGKLDQSQFNYVSTSRQDYFDSFVRDLLTHAMTAAVKERPANPQTFLIDFFEDQLK